MKKIFFVCNFIFVIVVSSYNFSMDKTEDLGIHHSNRTFLQDIQKQYENNNDKRELLVCFQKLATGLLVQARLMEHMPELVKSIKNINKANKNMRNFISGENIQFTKYNGNITGYCFRYIPKTIEGLRVRVKYAKYFGSNIDKALLVYNPLIVQPIIELLLKNPENLELCYYGSLLKLNLNVSICKKQYDKNEERVVNRYENIMKEHAYYYLNLVEFSKDSFISKKLTHMFLSINNNTNYEDDYAEYQPDHESLNNLYQQVVALMQQIIKSHKPQIVKKKKKGKQKKRNQKQKNSWRRFLKTLEKNSTTYPLSLDDPSPDELWIENFLLSKPQSQQQKQKKKLPPKFATNQNSKKISSLKVIYNMQTNISQQQKKKKIVYASDGSYTDSERTTEDEIVIVFPKTGATYHLYTLDNSKSPVKINLSKLLNKQNVTDWKKNPQEALEKQGYKSCGHKNFTQQENHNCMISIHCLPEEIKKYCEKFAQQTTINSRIRNENDIQVTFFGELHYNRWFKRNRTLYLLD